VKRERERVHVLAGNRTCIVQSVASRFTVPAARGK